MNCKCLSEGVNKSFWKRSKSAVPGNPKKEDSSTCKTSRSFVIYEKSVLDAWNILDDNFEGKRNSMIDLSRAHGECSDNKSWRGSLDNLKKNYFPPPEIFNDSQLRLRGIFRKCGNIDELKKISWNGIPNEMRATVWKLLSGYVPFDRESREEILERKRYEYWSFVDDNYERRYSILHKETFHQIHIDVPRMNPFIPVFQEKCVQEMFERILFFWAFTHPASGYVQGINDLVTPFFLVFVQQYIPTGKAYSDISIESVCKEELNALEADIYWCLTEFMSGIQDNYTFAQTGIQSNINKMRDLVQRLDVTLHKHLIENEVDYVQFAFRWFNNLLTRELTINCIIRLWDTYLSEGDDFPSFLPYMCTAFLLHFRERLLELKDFQGLMMLLQNLPTKDWSDPDVSLITADAYTLKVMFANSPKHLEKY